MKSIPELQGSRTIPGGTLLWNWDEGFLSIPGWGMSPLPLPNQMGFDSEAPDDFQPEILLEAGGPLWVFNQTAHLPKNVNLLRQETPGSPPDVYSFSLDPKLRLILHNDKESTEDDLSFLPDRIVEKWRASLPS